MSPRLFAQRGRMSTRGTELASLRLVNRQTGSSRSISLVLFKRHGPTSSPLFVRGSLRGVRSATTTINGMTSVGCSGRRRKRVRLHLLKLYPRNFGGKPDRLTPSAISFEAKCIPCTCADHRVAPLAGSVHRIRQDVKPALTGVEHVRYEQNEIPIARGSSNATRSSDSKAQTRAPAGRLKLSLRRAAARGVARNATFSEAARRIGLDAP